MTGGGCKAIMSATDYRFTIRPLTTDEGGGYLIEFPNLSGCMSDGETVEDAIANGMEAKRDRIAAMIEAGRPVPAPSIEVAEGYSEKWVLRTPKSLHRDLAERARAEGVSLNALAVAMLARGWGEGQGGGNGHSCSPPARVWNSRRSAR
jgi:antitoxin HicB